jgi:hypothetical protein
MHRSRTLPSRMGRSRIPVQPMPSRLRHAHRSSSAKPMARPSFWVVVERTSPRRRIGRGGVAGNFSRQKIKRRIAKRALEVLTQRNGINRFEQSDAKESA